MNNPAKAKHAGQATAIQRTLSQSLYSGPVPDPDTLGKYEAIQPGFAERLLTMAEKEQSNRHFREQADRDQEKYICDHIERQHLRDSKSFNKGQYLAFLSVILVVALCSYCVYRGFASQAQYIAIWVIVSLAGVFVLRKIVFPNISGEKKEGKDNKPEKEKKEDTE